MGLLLLFATATSFAAAQGPGDIFPNFPVSNFRFNFINPGGRATAMGQAFIALGDDATGSETNPAGLTALLTPQLFIEGRAVSNAFRTLNPSETDILYASTKRTVFSPTFISYVHPFRNWAFGAYRQELANYDVSIHQPTIAIPGANEILVPPPSPIMVMEYNSKININLVNYGASVARRWGERFNFGISVRASRMSIHFLETQPADMLQPGRRIVEGDTEAVLMRMDGEDWAFSWVGGFIIKPLNWLKIGGVYRSGSGHDFRAVFDENILDLAYNPLLVEISPFRINVPDRYGFGLAFTPTDDLTLTLDAIRVEYGDLTAQFTSYLQEEFQDDYEFANGNEIHVGAEYTFFVKDVPVSLRGGFYTDPDNSLHFIGDPEDNDVIYVLSHIPFPVEDVFDDLPRAQSALFPELGTDYHKTFGVGIIIKNHLLLDFAVDLSRDTDYYALSLLYNF